MYSILLLSENTDILLSRQELSLPYLANSIHELIKDVFTGVSTLFGNSALRYFMYVYITLIIIWIVLRLLYARY